MASTQFQTVGRRKSASARVFLRPGTGEIVVNKRDAAEYFKRDTLMMILRRPLTETSTDKLYDIYANVSGGGLSGQAGAVRHGIARALILVQPELRAELKAGGFLRRDARIKERKKYGQRGARARFQFSKR